MGLRLEFQKRIDKKAQEIESLELQIREAKIYIVALGDMMRLLPREEPNGGQGESVLKPGTAIAKARDAIKQAGGPLHIGEILASLGRPVDKANRAAIGGSIAAYVRRGEVFTRPAPNTFGLIEMSGAPAPPNHPPPEFGKD
jgi:hypothetical protein